MPCFMICSHFFICIRLESFLLRSQLYFCCGLLYICHRDSWMVKTCCTNCCLIEHVFQICSREADSPLCYFIPIYRCLERFSLCMNSQNCFSSFFIWHIQRYSSIKTSRSDKCWIEHIRSIGGRHNN